MSDCTDKRFENMLYAYETGMLTGEELRELELHLLECEYCFERAQRFERFAEMIRHSPQVRDVIKQASDEAPETVTDVRRPQRARYAIPAAAIAAAVLLVLVLKDWRIEIKPTQEAVAVENRLAVVYFDNKSEPGDPKKLGEIITNLLITDLSESRYLQVVSSQRVHDIVQLLSRESARPTDEIEATEVARRARASWMLTGSVLQTAPQLSLTAQLTDVTSGRVLASQKVLGTPDESIFDIVDRLTVEIKADLGVPVASPDERDRTVADVTSYSPEAYRLFVDGVDAYHKHYHDEAREKLTQAVELDSTFAVAYYYLSLLGRPNLIIKAMQHIDRATQREKYLIQSRAARVSGDVDGAIHYLKQALAEFPDDKTALYRLGLYRYGQSRYEEAAEYLEGAVAVDPLYKPVYNQLAYTYDRLGRFDQALQALDKYVELAPDEPNPYDSRGEICARNGRLDEAIASYRQALRVNPDFRRSLNYLGLMCLFRGDFACADSCFQVQATSRDKSLASAAWLYMTEIPVRRGQLRRALEVLDEGLEMDRLRYRTAPDYGVQNLKYLMQAHVYAELEQYDQALEAIEKFQISATRRRPEPMYNTQVQYVQMLVAAGDSEKARTVIEALKQELDEKQLPEAIYHLAAGLLALGTERTGEAIAHFQNVTEQDRGPYGEYWLAGAFLAAGRHDEAAATFRRFMSTYTSPLSFWILLWVKSHYYLGQTYEELGQYRAAMEQYETFLAIWKDADAGLTAVADAKSRLERLRNRS